MDGKPEIQWILEALKAWLHDAARPVACPAGLDPVLLEAWLNRNRLAPLFHTMPVTFPPGAAWDSLRSRIDAAYRQSLLRALRQMRSGTELMRQLGQGGIPSLALRGPFLAADAYGDPAARVGADIDILIRPADRRRAAHVCRDLGYRSMESAAPLWPLDAHRIHWRMQRPDDSVVCELHWALEPAYGVMTLPYAALFQRSVCIRKDGFEWLQPVPSLLFPWICVHAERHAAELEHAHSLSIQSGEESLQHGMLFRWLDAAMLLRKHGDAMDWEEIARQAADRRVCRGLVRNLKAVRNWLGAPLPARAEALLPEWEQAEQVQRSAGSRRRLESWWRRKAGKAVGLETRLEDVLYYLLPLPLFFHPSRGAALFLRRAAHAVRAGCILAGAAVLYAAYAIADRSRRRTLLTDRRPPTGTKPSR